MNTEVYKDEEAREMGLKDVVKAYLVKDAGILDAEKLVRFYEMEFLRLGGRVAYGVRVTGLLKRPRKPLGIPGEPFPWQNYEVRGVVTNNGVIEADKIVIATGAWTGDLMSSLSYGLPLRPRKR